MELLFVQLDISYSATIKEVPQILVVVKVSLFNQCPTAQWWVEAPNEINVWTASSTNLF